MKNFIKTIFFVSFYFLNNLISFADGGILGQGGLSDSDLKNGNIHTDDLPRIITGAIDFLMGFAGTISVVFIIIG
ncbi:MAG: hypothetical protein PHR68_03255, partial [Candidatus Gracilibacteria bacterium]|nr:hypothetical protein [Candidatus Gracilibacteria bacterium]